VEQSGPASLVTVDCVNSPVLVANLTKRLVGQEEGQDNIVDGETNRVGNLNGFGQGLQIRKLHPFPLTQTGPVSISTSA
jgi:hypothetical protein